MKFFTIFVVGVLIGGALLVGAQHLKRVHFLGSHATDMQMAVEGKWEGTANVEGQPFDFAIALKNDGKALQGVITSSQVGQIACDQVKVDAQGDVSFSAHAGDKSATFTGKLASDRHQISGNLNAEGYSGTWSVAKRS